MGKLKENVHVTQLSMFNSCSYNYKYGAGPIEPSLTFKGDILNVAVVSKGDYKPFLEWYKKNLEPDLKSLDILEEVFEKAKKMKGELLAKFDQVWQEAKFLRKYSDEYWVTGSPDLVYYDPERDLYCIRDWKMSTHSWYGNPEVTAYDMQPIFYSLFIMDFFNVDKAEFAFWCYDKKNAKLGQFGAKKGVDGPAIYTRDEVEAIAKDVMSRYEYSVEWDDYQPRANKKCGFCSLKQSGQCPLYKREVKVVEQNTDDFF